MKKSRLVWLIGILITVVGFAVVIWTNYLNQLPDDARPMNQPSRSITAIQNDVMSKGDTNAYHELKTAYLDYSPEEFLFWALIMANKYDYPPAYLDVYYTLGDAYGCDVSTGILDNMDRKTRAMALNFLEIAAQKNSIEAKEILKKHHKSGEYIPVDRKSRKKEIKE